MEDESELKHAERSDSECNTLVENTESFGGLTQPERVEDQEEETENVPHTVSETVEDEVAEQEPQISVGLEEDVLTEDVSMTALDAVASGRDTTESGPGMVPEEEAEIEPLLNEITEDTEGPEMFVKEDLPLEGTMTAENEEDQKSPSPDPYIPDGEGSSPPDEPLVPAEEEEEVDLSIKNHELLELLQELREEKDKLTKLHGQLQSRIAEYLSRKTGHDKQPKLVEDISDQEQYLKYIDLMKALKLQHKHSLDLNQKRIEDLRQQCQEKQNQVESELQSFASQKNEAVATALTGKVGKQATLEKVEQLQADEQKREDELTSVRLDNIKLRKEICKLEATLLSEQELADGLLLMDFEQLKTENQTFKEKFKERSEELLRLKKKVACSVQGITHVKEKMHFMQRENVTKRTELTEADALVAAKRDVLTRTRQARDRLRADNLKLQQRCGLRGNSSLLRDFEETVDTSENLQQGLEALKRRHAELVLKCAGVKKKIEQSRPDCK